MSTSSIEKADIQHQESVEIVDIEAQSPQKKSRLPPPPHFSELVEFQKTLIGPAIGFAAFGLSSFVMGLFNSGLITTIPQVAVGIAFGYGSLGQFCAGIIEIFNKNVFNAASFITFGSFFLSFGVMMIPGAGFFETALETNQLNNCMGLIEISYAIAAFIFFMGTLKQPILVRMFLGLSTLSFLLPAAGSFSGITGLTVAGGWTSFTLALVAWYALAACIYNEQNTYFVLPFF